MQDAYGMQQEPMQPVEKRGGGLSGSPKLGVCQVLVSLVSLKGRAELLLPPFPLC